MQPAVAGGHFLGADRAAGRNEAELEHSIRRVQKPLFRRRSSTSRILGPPLSCGARSKNAEASKVRHPRGFLFFSGTAPFAAVGIFDEDWLARSSFDPSASPNHGSG